ncbi:MAG: YwaF family protein [Treponema sp.]|nr:YwaF family protein [Treponema sp.]
MRVYDIQYPMGLFSVSHIIFLVVLWTLAAILAFYFSKKLGYNKKLIWVCAIIGILSEIEKILFFIEGTEFGFRLPAEHLPFNMCPFQIFLIFALAVSECPKKCKILLYFMYPTMVGGGFIGMLIPSAAINFHGLVEFATYRYFIYHAMLIFLGLYLYLSKPVEYTIKSFGIASGLIFLVLILAIWLNAFFGWNPDVNFWFIVRPPVENIPVLNFNHGWLVYMLHLGWICMVLFIFCYLKEIIGEVKSIIGKIKKK